MATTKQGLRANGTLRRYITIKTAVLIGALKWKYAYGGVLEKDGG